MAHQNTRFLPAIAVLVLAVAAATGVHAQTCTMLHSFNNNVGDPLRTVYSGIVAQGRDGNLYSTSFAGGQGSTADGTTFRVTPSGTLTVVYSFDLFSFHSPSSGLTLGTDGFFYGTSTVGSSNPGTIFKADAGGNVIVPVLYGFTGLGDGGDPVAPPIEGTDGNFYGTTFSGGGGTVSGGVVYKITPGGTFKTLHVFSSTDGAGPTAPLVQGSDGKFYGTTSFGSSGATAEGTVFKITSTGKIATIYKFDITHGRQPIAPLALGSDGNFYGTTTEGGANGLGVVFKITSGGKLTLLHSFSGTDGQTPQAGLVQANDGTFYGTAAAGGKLGFGNVYKITSAGVFNSVCDFDKTTGATPEVTLIQHTNGLFYGDTAAGGGTNQGVFYSVNDSQQPFVSLLTTSGKVGATIEILGQGFTGTTGVFFNGVSAAFTIDPVNPDTYITAAVPNGATKGKVMVVTSTGTLTSNKVFTVLPTILSFNPTSGAVGASVAVTGSGLTKASKVTFGGVKATTFTVNSDSQVTAAVPTGAKTGKIAITTPAGAATSSGTFTVTP
jgi:uncharacterized repeat protein (TIGR03803 family)